jgi:hypothetical protein
MKTLYEAANGLEAHMLADVLKQEGIRAQVMGSYLPGALGELPAAGLVRLVVEDEDFVRARSVIERWEATQAPEPAQGSAVPDRSGSPWSWGLGGLVLGAGLCFAALRMPVQESGIDHNRDGQLDERWTYSLTGVALGAEVDRNFDSRTDLRLHYNMAGELDVEERDDDFDGTFETRTTYRMNQAQRTEADTDGDGMVDSVTHFTHGVYRRMDYIDPRSGQPSRIEHMRLGRLDQVERDTDGDAVPDLREHYNALGQITRTERIRTP